MEREKKPTTETINAFLGASNCGTLCAVITCAASVKAHEAREKFGEERKKNAEQAFWKGLTGEARDIKKIDMHIDQLHMRCEVELTSKQSHLGARERDLPLVGVCWCGVVRVEA